MLAQNNTSFGEDMGGGDYINVFNIETVYPVTRSDEWNADFPRHSHRGQSVHKWNLKKRSE